MQNLVGVNYEYLKTLSAFTAGLDFASAAACRTITVTTTSGANRFFSEYDDRVGDFLPRCPSFAVTAATIPVSGEVTIGAGFADHTAYSQGFNNSDLVSRNGQDNSHKEEAAGWR